MSDPRRAALTDLLARYAPRNEEEQGHLARMGALLEQAHPFSRHHATPGHFTASAFVLSPAGDALYLIHHKKLGRWLQPGGHIEPDDSDLLAAARREVLEEVGLAGAPLLDEARPVFDVDVHGIPAHKGEPAHEHFDVRFCFRAPSLAAPRPSDEVAGGRWCSLEELCGEGHDESVRRAAAKLRRP
jgi:8-oxo-dGTP pyrophosphatase MutT (NUDIX family)